MPVAEATAPVAANAIAIALKFWNAGYHDYASLTAYTLKEIATLEHKLQSDPATQGRARRAAAYVIAMKSGSDYPGGITAAIGNFVGSLPFVKSPVDESGHPIPKPAVSKAIESPLTVAEFLAKLSDVSTWIRVAEVAGGAWLLYVGVRMLARESNVTLPSLKRG
jgi:hypothetical protein